MSVYELLSTIQSLCEDYLEQYDETEMRIYPEQIIKRLDNLHIETRPISPEQETKFLYYNMAVDDCLKVVRTYLESVNK